MLYFITKSRWVASWAQVLAQRLHFNTFGGNPVCSAGGRAVLRAIDEDGIQANSAKVRAGLQLSRSQPSQKSLPTLRYAQRPCVRLLCCAYFMQAITRSRPDVSRAYCVCESHTAIC